MTRYSAAVAIASCLYLHSAFAQNQLLPLAPLPSTTAPYQTLGAPGESFPSFNSPSPTFQSFNTSTIGGYNPVPASGTLLQQVYPATTQQPFVSPSTLPGALPGTPGLPPGAETTGLPLMIREVPRQNVAPPDLIAAGLATIKQGKWVISDFFYNLSEFIGVRVEILKPQDKNIPLNGSTIERQIKSILENVANISTEANIVPCGPPLPVFHVLIMAYPCHNCCVGFVTAQLVERGRPERMQLDVNGIWQIITWERQTLVASNCEDFANQISSAVNDMTIAFANRFAYYHPRPEIPCFNVSENSRLPPPNYNNYDDCR
jgi:hypothetical protein